MAAFAEFADYQTQKYSDVVPISEEILDEGITRGASILKGPRKVTITTSLRHFHSGEPNDGPVSDEGSSSSEPEF